VPPSADYCAVLTLLIRKIESGKLRFRRNGCCGKEVNQWEVVET
jgi:hypothetical protein